MKAYIEVDYIDPDLSKEEKKEILSEMLFLKCVDWIEGDEIPIITFIEEDDSWYKKIFNFKKKYQA